MDSSQPLTRMASSVPGAPLPENFYGLKTRKIIQIVITHISRTMMYIDLTKKTKHT